MNINDYNKVTDRLEPQRDCFKEAVNMLENKKHRFVKRKIIPVIAVAAVMGGTLTAVYADEIANVFRKAENTQQMTLSGPDGEQYQVNKLDRLNYSELEKHAELTDADCSTNGLNVKAKSVFCDGENLAVMLTAENTNPDFENAYHIWAKGVTVKIDGKTYSSTDDSESIWVDMICDYEGAPTYTGTLQFPIPEKSRFTGSKDVAVHISTFDFADAFQNSGRVFSGCADLIVKVTADESGNRLANDGYSDENVEVSQVKSTPYALSVRYKVNSTKSLVLMVYDQNGNRLDRNLENQGSCDGDYATEYFASTDSEVVTLNFADKNSDDLDVISSFEVPLK